MTLRFLTAGESHGPQLTAILEGLPAGLPLRPEDLQQDMTRRQTAYGAGGRMAIEEDRVRITGGVMGGATTGGPVCMVVENKDWRHWRDKEIPPMTTPRPGHADLTGALKYGYGDLRMALERASARETAARVAVGAVLKRFLAAFGIEIGSYVVGIGKEMLMLPLPGGQQAPDIYRRRFSMAEQNEVRCPDDKAAVKMKETIAEAMRARDTLGGQFEIIALGLPPGLGSYVHYDRRLTGRLAGAVMSIPAIKGVEVGPAFENACLPGTEVHDELFKEEDNIIRRSNRAGGLEGGITTGEPLVIRAAMKPISTTLRPLSSIDLKSGEAAKTQYERSDFCAVPRAAVVGEAMVAFVLAEALLEKLGGDSMEVLQERFTKLPQNRLDDVHMSGESCSFGID